MKHISELLSIPATKRELYSTGIDAVDKMIGGYQLGEIIAIAGHAATGRETLLKMMAGNISKQGTPVGLFSLPNRVEWITSDLSHLCGAFNEDAPLWIYEHPCITTKELMSQIETLNEKHNVHCFVIGGFEFSDWVEEWTTRAVVMELKRMAANMKLAFIVGSELSYSSWERTDAWGRHKPQLCDLPGYLVSNFSEHADVIIGVYRPESDGFAKDQYGNDLRGVIELNVLKSPRGEFETTKIHLDCLKYT